MLIFIFFYIPIIIKALIPKPYDFISFWFSYCSCYIDFFLNQKILFIYELCIYTSFDKDKSPNSCIATVEAFINFLVLRFILYPQRKLSRYDAVSSIKQKQLNIKPHTLTIRKDGGTGGLNV